MGTTRFSGNRRSVEERLRRRAASGRFDDGELQGLPEPVRRYFRAAVAPGAPLARAAEVKMRGKLKLNGRWLSMSASEVLAPHDGFVWRARVAGMIAGSDRCVDGHGAMNWKLLGLFRIAHAEGPDTTRSAAARAGR